MKELHSNIKGLQVLKYGLVSRKEKNSRSVVFCIPKGYGAAEVALRGRFSNTLRLTYTEIVSNTMENNKTQSPLRYHVKGA